MPFRGGEGCNQLAEAAAIDVVNLGHIQQNLSSTGFDGILDQLPQGLGSLAKRNGALQVEDENEQLFIRKLFTNNLMLDSRPYECLLFGGGNLARTLATTIEVLENCRLR